MLNKAPSVYTLSTLDAVLKSGNSCGRGGVWAPARPDGFYSVKNRLRLAWEVFTGRADVLRWPLDQ